MKIIYSLFIFLLFSIASHAQVEYPYPVKYIQLLIDGKEVKMAYMDVHPAQETGKNILLLHGKNFNGYYWKNVITFLVKKGYRVIVPDQVGWGKSDRPDLHYSFFMLANNTKILLDSLGVNRTVVLGHSMGGMLAARFALMYPSNTGSLVLENPIGLEDYKTFVPWQPLEILWEKEKKASFESYKKYQQSYYPQWKPEYEQYVQAQAADLASPNFDSIARVNALTFQLILEQPLVYELPMLKVPLLLMIGTADRTIVGKDQLNDSTKKLHGQYQLLGRQIRDKIPGSRLVEFPGVGHIPHIQEPAKFEERLLSFLK